MNGHVRAGSEERAEDGVLVAVDDGVVGAGGVVIVVRLAGVSARGAGSVVALHFDRIDHGVVVADLLDVLRVPVDCSTGPGDRTGRVGGESTRPEGELYSCWGLWEVPLVRGRVPSVGLLLGASYDTVYGPCDLIGGPVDLVCVPVVEGICNTDVS